MPNPCQIDYDKVSASGATSVPKYLQIFPVEIFWVQSDSPNISLFHHFQCTDGYKIWRARKCSILRPLTLHIASLNSCTPI